jgi:hypothetical protein
VGRCLALVFLSGCFYGGGPVVGYGRRGFVWGAEATTGWSIGSVSAGYQSTGRGYLHAAFDRFTGENRPHIVTVGHPLGSVRIGGGLSTGLHDADVGYQSGECNDKWSDALNVTLEARYVGQWELVLVPRYEHANIFCSGH